MTPGRVDKCTLRIHTLREATCPAAHNDPSLRWDDDEGLGEGLGPSSRTLGYASAPPGVSSMARIRSQALTVATVITTIQPKNTANIIQKSIAPA